MISCGLQPREAGELALREYVLGDLLVGLGRPLAGKSNLRNGTKKSAAFVECWKCFVIPLVTMQRARCLRDTLRFLSLFFKWRWRKIISLTGRRSKLTKNVLFVLILAYFKLI